MNIDSIKRLNLKSLIKQNWQNAIKVLFLLTASAILRMFSLNMFIVPNKLAPGGVSGIASILNNLNPFFKTGVTIMVINIPLFVISFFALGKKFVFLTVGESILSTACIDFIYPLIAPHIDINSFSNDLFFCAVMGGVLTGFAVAFVLKTGGSSGGTDIMGLLARKKFSSASIAMLIFFFDAIITITSGIVFRDLKLVMYSFIALFVASKTNEIMLSGFASAVAVYIITEKREEVVHAIFETIKRGVTDIKVTGSYTNSEKHMLLVLIRKRQIGPTRTVVKSIDPKAFMFSSMVTEVIGQGFSSRS